MVGRGGVAMAALLALGACAAGAPGPTSPVAAGAGQSAPAALLPAEGVAVLTPAPGELDAFLLVPCRGGGAACLGGPAGSATSPFLTSGLVAGSPVRARTYRLGSGGSGVATQGTAAIPLAWAPRAEGTGVGVAATLESSVPHGFADPLVPR